MNIYVHRNENRVSLRAVVILIRKIIGNTAVSAVEETLIVLKYLAQSPHVTCTNITKKNSV